MFNESKLHSHEEERLDKCWTCAELTDFSSLSLLCLLLTTDIKTNLHIDFTFLVFCTFYIFVNIFFSSAKSMLLRWKYLED